MTDPFEGDAHGENDERTTRELVRALDAEAGALDPRTVARLGRARRAALAHEHRVRPPSLRSLAEWHGPGPALAGTAAAVALVALLVASMPPRGAPDRASAPLPVAAPVDVDALPVLSGAEELEFYESIDFLLWLEGRRA